MTSSRVFFHSTLSLSHHLTTNNWGIQLLWKHFGFPLYLFICTLLNIRVASGPFFPSRETKKLQLLKQMHLICIIKLFHTTSLAASCHIPNKTVNYRLKLQWKTHKTTTEWNERHSLNDTFFAYFAIWSLLFWKFKSHVLLARFRGSEQQQQKTNCVDLVRFTCDNFIGKIGFYTHTQKEQAQIQWCIWWSTHRENTQQFTCSLFICVHAVFFAASIGRSKTEAAVCGCSNIIIVKLGCDQEANVHFNSFRFSRIHLKKFTPK